MKVTHPNHAQCGLLSHSWRGRGADGGGGEVGVSQIEGNGGRLFTVAQIIKKPMLYWSPLVLCFLPS